MLQPEIKIDMEELDTKYENDMIVYNAGYSNYERFLEYKYEVAQGLMKYGSLFGRNLGKALHNADRDNALKILRYWENMCYTYSMMFRADEAKEST